AAAGGPGSSSPRTVSSRTDGSACFQRGCGLSLSRSPMGRCGPLCKKGTCRAGPRPRFKPGLCCCFEVNQLAGPPGGTMGTCTLADPAGRIWNSNGWFGRLDQLFQPTHQLVQLI